MVTKVRKFRTLAMTVAAIVALGLLINWLPGWESSAPQMSQPTGLGDEAAKVALSGTPGKTPLLAPDDSFDKQGHVRSRQLELRFQQAVVMMHARRYEEAVAALHEVLRLEPRLVEAHVNMGFALLELGSPKAAIDFFITATQLRPEQANAYFGLGEAYEKQGDLELALGAMQTYQHLPEADPAFVRKAESAVWEWRDTLRRQREQNEVTENKAAQSQRVTPEK